jgi:hypothetical protein
MMGKAFIESICRLKESIAICSSLKKNAEIFSVFCASGIGVGVDGVPIPLYFSSIPTPAVKELVE